MNNIVIELDNVWKRYPLEKDRPGFKEFMVNFYKIIKRKRNNINNHFYAIRGLSLKIKKGECIGIIGKNGAGKTTLLSIIIGTISPSKGKVKVTGRITPLLELGAGFHPDLTGRENIVLNGILLGLTKIEILDKMNSIISFSELEEFIDLPLRTYSNGMYLRLAFSVAIHTEPDILIIDEVLSVGDERFQKKSKDAILKLIKGGITTVFVSHSLKDIEEICDRVIWLHHGEVVNEGDPKTVIESYRRA